LLGDDGVGHVVLERLRIQAQWSRRVAFHRIEGDLFELDDWVGRIGHLIVLDALVGQPIGQIDLITGGCRLHAPSFHHTDVATLLAHLEAIHGPDSFPRWEVWGVRIAMPTEFTERLSEPVARAAGHLQGVVTARIRGFERGDAPDGGHREPTNRRQG
jgi:hydrogenase maturation protease